MANWIESQLCVTGTKETIENFKNTFITKYEDGYDLNFDKLFANYKYVLSKNSIGSNQICEDDLHDILLLEELTPNFDFNYLRCLNYYEYTEKENQRYNVYSWVDYGYHTNEHILIEENIIMVRFSSKWYPPVHAIIHFSKSFPEAYFRHAFYDISWENTLGCIEGQNGIFKDTKHDFGFHDEKTKEPVYQNKDGYWFYSSTNQEIKDECFSPAVTTCLFL